jgi:hypothetical protein
MRNSRLASITRNAAAYSHSNVPTSYVQEKADHIGIVALISKSLSFNNVLIISSRLDFYHFSVGTPYTALMVGMKV